MAVRCHVLTGSVSPHARAGVLSGVSDGARRRQIPSRAAIRGYGGRVEDPRPHHEDDAPPALPAADPVIGARAPAPDPLEDDPIFQEVPPLPPIGLEVPPAAPAPPPVPMPPALAGDGPSLRERLAAIADVDDDDDDDDDAGGGWGSPGQVIDVPVMGEELEYSTAEAIAAAHEDNIAPDIAEAPSDEADGGPAHAVLASRATLAAHPALSLQTTPAGGGGRGQAAFEVVNAIDNAVSVFSALQPGQKGFIRVSLRAAPEFKAAHAEWIQATRTGQSLDTPSRGTMAYRTIKWLFRMGNHLASGAADQKLPAPPPPWKKSTAVQPMRASDMSDEMRQAIRDAELKARDTAHYEVNLRIGVVGPSEEAINLEAIRGQAEIAFADAFATPHQRAVFEECDGYDAVSGFVSPETSMDMVLSATEIGEIAHIPDDTAHPQGVVVRRARVKPLPLTNPIVVPDAFNPPPGVIPLGKINADTEDEQVVGMNNAELDKHAFIVGRTGTGKSKLMEWLMFGVAKSDYPIVLIDPHGALFDDMAANIITHCPERIDDLVLIDFSDPDWPVALNPLDIHSAEQIEPTVHSIMEMLSRQMSLAGTSAPRAVNYAQQALTVLAEANLKLPPEAKCTLLQVQLFFTDTAFRQLLVAQCSNPSVREAFDPEFGPFETLNERQQIEHAMPILRAFQPLGNSRAFANVFSSSENKLDFTRLIRRNSIVLLKLSRFAHQKALASFAGTLIIPWMLSTMDDWGRKRDPDTQQLVGRGCRLFVDEAPTLFGPNSSAMEVLAEARKWDFGLIAAAQYPKQLDGAVENALYSNTATKVSLALDPSGVGGMHDSLSGSSGLIQRDDIVALPNYVGYANVLLNSANSGPFSMHTLPPLDNKMNAEHRKILDEVLARSHALVCNPAADVEARRDRIVEDIKTALIRMSQDQMAGGDEPPSAAGMEGMVDWSGFGQRADFTFSDDPLDEDD